MNKCMAEIYDPGGIQTRAARLISHYHNHWAKENSPQRSCQVLYLNREAAMLKGVVIRNSVLEQCISEPQPSTDETREIHEYVICRRDSNVDSGVNQHSSIEISRHPHHRHSHHSYVEKNRQINMRKLCSTYLFEVVKRLWSLVYVYHKENMLQTACNDTIISITWCDQENNLHSLFELWRILFCTSNLDTP